MDSEAGPSKKPRLEDLDSGNEDNDEKLDGKLCLSDSECENGVLEETVKIEVEEEYALDPLFIPVNNVVQVLITPPNATNVEPPIWSFKDEVKTVLQFTKNREFYAGLPPDPMAYFEFFLDENFLTMICNGTNHYAENLSSDDVPEEYRIKTWKELTPEELKIFIGLLLHTGTIQLTKLENYWNTNRLFNIQIFSEKMSMKRFFLILRCLNFTTEADDSNPMSKITNIIRHFNQKMILCYYPEKDLLLNDSMVLCRDRLIYRQIQDKQNNGIKLFMLTETNGIILNFQVYMGPTDIELSPNDYNEQIVIKLLEGKLGNGHSIYMHPNYNSYNLAKHLLDNRIYCTGILSNMTNIPTQILTKKLNEGHNISIFANGVHVGRHQLGDDNTIFITTELDNTLGPLPVKKGEIFKCQPFVMIQYNKYMSEENSQEEVLQFYPCEKIPFRWYKKIFIHILQLLLLNSHKFYNEFSGAVEMTFYDYRLAIIDALLPTKATYEVNKKLIASAASVSASSSVHRISKISDKNKAGRINRKMCRVCSKQGRRKDSIYHCAQCAGQPGLCIECFDIFHYLYVK